jgi:hypothetical protein
MSDASPISEIPETLPAKGSLVEVAFETHLGAKYMLPDMDCAEMEKLATFFPTSYSSITLVNVSQACLVLPLRTVRVFYINGVERWRHPG